MKRKFVFFLILAFSEGGAGAEQLSFKAALRELGARNTEIQMQKAELKKSEARRLSSLAAFLPTISAKATDNQTQTPAFIQSQQGLLVGSLNLFRAGSDAASLRSNRAAVRRDQFQLRQVELEEEQNNITLLIRFIQTAHQQRVAATILRLNEELAQIEEARYRRGLIPLQDSQKAVIERSNSLARLQDSQARHEEARAALAVQLGHADVQQEWPWRPDLVAAKAERWINQDLKVESTPAWQAGMEAVEGESQLVRSRLREHLPSLDLNVGYGYLDYLATKETGWDTTLTLTIPLVDLKKTADYRLQSQQETIARLNLEKTKRSLLGRWQATKEKLALALKSAKEREESKAMAQGLYQDNQLRLRAGRSNMNDVIVDQNRLGDAEILAINGWAEAHLLYSQLCHALGLRVNLDELGCRE